MDIQQVHLIINLILEKVMHVYNFGMAYFPDETALIIGAIVSPLLAIGAKFSRKWDSLKDVQRLGVMVALSGIAVSINYLLKTPTIAPEIAIPAATLFLSVANQPYYKLAVRPLGRLIGRQWAKLVAKTLSYDTDVRSAEVPAGGLPVSSGTPVDFSK